MLMFVNKSTFTNLQNLMWNFSTFLLACLFYFQSKKFCTSVNVKIKRAKKLINFADW